MISSREIQNFVRFVLPIEIAKHTICEGTKVVTKSTSRLRFAVLVSGFACYVICLIISLGF